MTPQELIAYIEGLIIDNTTQQVTPYKMRAVLTEMVNSLNQSNISSLSAVLPLEYDPFTNTLSLPVINNLTAGGTNSVLSAEQGKILKQLIDDLVVSGVVPTLQQVTDEGNIITDGTSSSTALNNGGLSVTDLLSNETTFFGTNIQKQDSDGLATQTIEFIEPTSTEVLLVPNESGTLATKEHVAQVSVPYTGATTDVDLGNHNLNAKSVKINGTAGAGHLGLKHQSAPATASGSETALYAGSDGELYYKNDGGTVAQIASRAWTLAQGFLTSIADATSSVKGILKLYSSTGSNTDGTMTQKSVTDALDLKVDKTSWIDYSATSTIVGFSSFTTKVIRYKQISDNVIWVKGVLSGVSNSTVLNFTIPFTSANNVKNVGVSGVVNNGTTQAGPGFATCNQNTNIVNIFRDFNGTAFTTSGTKTGEFSIYIEV